MVGALVGGLVVGLAGGGSSSEVGLPAATSSAATGTPGPSPAGSGGATGEVTVNAACVRAVNDAQDTYAAINDLADAASSLNAARLDEIVRRLQPLQRRLEADLRACRVATRLPDGSVSSGPVPLPTG